MLDESLPPGHTGDVGRGHSTDEDEELLHMRRATSLLRLLRSSQDPSLDSGDLKREFLQLTALLRKIDQLANEESLEAEAAPMKHDEPPEHAAARKHDFESNGSTAVFGPQRVDDDEVEPVATDWWEGAAEYHRAEQDSAGEDEGAPDWSGQDEHETSASTQNEQHDSGATPTVERPHVQPLIQTAQEGAHEASDSTAESENLARWWVTFNGNISLERLARLRSRLGDSPFTIETRFDEIGDGLIVLRVVTDSRVTMQQVDWILRELMETVGLDRDSAILTPQ